MPVNDVRGLGSYMRDVGMRLTDAEPMTFEMAHEIISYQDLGYAAAVLIRLHQRGIAAEAGKYSYIRGPRWHEAAKMYKWEE